MTFNLTRNVFEIFSRREDGFAPKLQAFILKKLMVLAQEKEKVAAEVRKRSEAVYTCYDT